MNWYREYKLAKARAAIDSIPVSKCIGGKTLDPFEKILAAAVLASGKIYTGPNHGIATKKAIDDGAGKYTGGYNSFESTDGSPSSTDLFITDKNRVIDRFTAFEQRDIAASERITKQKMPGMQVPT